MRPMLWVFTEFRMPISRNQLVMAKWPRLAANTEKFPTRRKTGAPIRRRGAPPTAPIAILELSEILELRPAAPSPTFSSPMPISALPMPPEHSRRLCSKSSGTSRLAPRDRRCNLEAPALQRNACFARACSDLREPHAGQQQSGDGVDHAGWHPHYQSGESANPKRSKARIAGRCSAAAGTWLPAKVRSTPQAAMERRQETGQTRRCHSRARVRAPQQGHENNRAVARKLTCCSQWTVLFARAAL